VLGNKGEATETGLKLSWERVDIERRFSVSAGKHTDVNSLFACLIGALIAGAFYGFTYVYRSDSWTDMFLERGLIPYVIIFFSGWSLAILLLKWTKLRLQVKALGLEVVPHAHDFVLSRETARDVLERLYTVADDPKKFVLLNRVQRCLSSLRNMGRLADVGELLRTQSENDESVLESSYVLLQGFIWAIPVLGFIGTVVGLSDAISGFGGVLEGNSDMSELREGLRSVTSGLSVAFETTLVALVAALVIQLLTNVLRRKEYAFLNDCDDYCQENLVGKVRVIPNSIVSPGDE
jgi:biopolymer transport protein ExbB/TolQ